MARGPTWAKAFFAGDRLARDALSLGSPQGSSEDLATLDAAGIGPRILAIGERLYARGSLAEIPTWETEESLEFEESVRIFCSALEAKSSAAFTECLERAAKKAEEGYHQMGRLASRLSALRWCSVLCWLTARAQVVNKVSAGGSFGTVAPAQSAQASRLAKHRIFDWLHELTKRPDLLVLFDYDLVGQGVWHDGGREPMSREGEGEWFRRAAEYDVARLCHQARNLPPEDINAGQPVLAMVQRLGTPTWYLPPPEAPRHMLERHKWQVEMRQAPIEALEGRTPLNGAVLHAEAPEPPEPDLDDPEVVAKVQRGEDLGKGDQEDGLPGAVHSSMGMLYAAMCWAERVQYVRIYPRLLALDGFLEAIFRFGPALRHLSLRGCSDLVTHHTLQVLRLAGRCLTTLDLAQCGIDGDLVQPLVYCLESLPNMRELDLSWNGLDGDAAVLLVKQLCELRVDLNWLCLDGNDLGDLVEFRGEVALSLVGRGEGVVAGGSLIFRLGGGVSWSPQQLPEPPNTTAYKEVQRLAEDEKERLEKFEELLNKKPGSRPLETIRRDWLDKAKAKNQELLDILNFDPDSKVSVMLALAKREQSAEQVDDEDNRISSAVGSGVS